VFEICSLKFDFCLVFVSWFLVIIPITLISPGQKQRPDLPPAFFPVKA
jgi:hypothetical protein